MIEDMIPDINHIFKKGILRMTEIIPTDPDFAVTISVEVESDLLGNSFGSVQVFLPDVGTTLSCSSNPELFDPQSHQDYRMAKEICSRCPEKQIERCNEMAVVDSGTGVYGGIFYRWGVPQERPRFGRAIKEY